MRMRRENARAHVGFEGHDGSDGQERRVLRRCMRLQRGNVAMSVALLWLCLFNFIGHQRPDRYFKEDHLTGADYIWLGADQTYRVTGREHMGVWVFESGRWEHSDGRIRFVPTEAIKKSYTGTEANHKGHTFLEFTKDAALGLAIPIEEIKRRIDADPKTRPSYVFFEIDRTAYERETKETYPFRTKRVANRDR